MRAVRYYGKEDVRLEEVPAPELLPGTVRITPAFTGICGSDLHLYFDGPIPPAPADSPHPISGEQLPVVFGHEFSGTITEVGEGVEGLAVGDNVVVEPLMVCGQCPPCNANRYNLCEKMGFIGISGRGGGLAEQVVTEQRFVHPIGDLPLDQGALIEPLAVGMHAVKHAGVVDGGTAVIGGAGPIGLLTAAILKARGMRVVMSEVSAARKDIARSTGVADLVVDPSEQDLPAVVREFTDDVGADVAFDAAGIKPVVDALLASLRPGGRLEVVAIHVSPVELDLTGQLIMGDKAIGGAIGYANDHVEAIELARSGAVDLSKFITRKISVDDIVEDGYKRLRDHGETEVKILVHM